MEGKKEASVISKWRQGGKRDFRTASPCRRKGAGVGRKHESSHRTTQRKRLKCLCCRKVGSGWPVTVLPLALGPEFKSYIGLKSRADFAIALPARKGASKREGKIFSVLDAHGSSLQSPAMKGYPQATPGSTSSLCSERRKEDAN